MSSTTSIDNGMAAKVSASGGSRSAQQPSRARLGSRPGTFQTLLVPTDFSPESREAFSEALGLAHQFDGSVHLLHVVEKKAPLALDSQTLMPPEKSLIAMAKKTLVAFAQQGSESHPVVPVFPFTRAGEPWREIVQAARERKADAIILGTRGHTGLQHVLLGSVAERVVRHSPVTVIVVRPRAPAESAAEPAKEAA